MLMISHKVFWFSLACLTTRLGVAFSVPIESTAPTEITTTTTTTASHGIGSATAPILTKKKDMVDSAIREKPCKKENVPFPQAQLLSYVGDGDTGKKNESNGKKSYQVERIERRKSPSITQSTMHPKRKMMRVPIKKSMMMPLIERKMMAKGSPTPSPTKRAPTKSALSPSVAPTSPSSSVPNPLLCVSPTTVPSRRRSFVPSTLPTVSSSSAPSTSVGPVPGSVSSRVPGTGTSGSPSSEPTSGVSSVPSTLFSTSASPSAIPSSLLSSAPSTLLSASASPSSVPSSRLISVPSNLPTAGAPATAVPSSRLDIVPSTQPSGMVSSSSVPSSLLTLVPSNLLSKSASPSDVPSSRLSSVPSSLPTAGASSTAVPSSSLDIVPSTQPSAVVTPSSEPSSLLTAVPSTFQSPSASPNAVPSSSLSSVPSTSLPSAVTSTNTSSLPTTAPMRTNAGRKFLFVELPNFGASEETGIIIMNVGLRDATVDVIGSQKETTRTLTIPAGEFSIQNFTKGGLVGTGTATTFAPVYKVESTEDVLVYVFIPIIESFSNEASLIFPVTALGTTYFVSSHQGEYSFGSMFGVVAVDNNTKVEVFDNFGEQIDTVTLEEGQVFQSVNEESLMTGWQIVSDKPIAAFSGTDCTSVGSSPVACDMLYEMLMPVSDLASEYVACPTATRPLNCTGTECSPDMFQVIATQDNTTVTFSPTFVRESVVLDQGQSIEYESQVPHTVIADKPVSFNQLLVSGQAGTPQAGIGDPSLIVVTPPTEFSFLNAFIIPPDLAAVNFITVTFEKGSPPSIDGGFPDIDEFLCPADLEAGVIDGVSFCCATVSVDVGAHSIESNWPFGLVVTGFSQGMSYGYTGGFGFL